MCGFVGYFSRSGQPISGALRRRLESSLEAISHRGPDDRHVEEGEGWWIGFRRLAILDLSNDARQPMKFDEGSKVLAFNGEIYNFEEVRGELNGRCGRSTGDTIVLGESLLQRGVDKTLENLRGMFAFVWWDQESAQLVAARDPFGMKPLYFSSDTEDEIFISSEIGPLGAIAQ